MARLQDTEHPTKLDHKAIKIDRRTEEKGRRSYDKFPTDEVIIPNLKQDSYSEDETIKQRHITFHLSKEQEELISKVSQESGLDFNQAYRKLHDKAFSLLVEFWQFKRRVDDVYELIKIRR